MPYYLTIFAQPTGLRLPYQLATAAQRTLAVSHLQQRLGVSRPVRIPTRPMGHGPLR